MIDLIWSILELVVVVLGITYIHELGHYAAGRWMVGIPPADIKLVMTEVPQHVALRDDDEWVGPDEYERYSELYGEHDPDYEHLEAYIGAGELVQTIGVVVIAALLIGVGLDGVASSIVLISLFMTGFYIAYDVSFSAYIRNPAGDYSALWVASPLAAIAVLLGFLVPHVLIYLSI